MKGEDFVSVKLDDLVDWLERLDHLETEVRALRQRVDGHDEDLTRLDDRTIMDIHIGGGRL